MSTTGKHILGISCFYHDSAACLITDGNIVAAAQEERFSRKRHDESFPIEAIKYCFQEGGVFIDDVDIIAFYDSPFLKFERLLETYTSFAPRGISSFLHALPAWLTEKFWVEQISDPSQECGTGCSDCSKKSKGFLACSRMLNRQVNSAM